LLVLHRFQDKHQRLPKHDNKEDLEKLKAIRKEHFAEIDADETILSDELLKEFISGIGAEIAPITAITGGFLGQEIIKVLSGKDLPVSNYFLFDNNGVGSVELLD